MGWRTKRKSKQARRPAPRRFGIEKLESRVACAVDFDFAFVSSGDSAQASATAVDAQGNVFVAGEFYGKVDFDPSAAEYSLNGSGSDGVGDIFLAKYTGDGQFLWARKLGTFESADSVGGLAVDASGNVIVGGDQFAFFPDFGYQSDSFIAKFDAGGGLVFQQFLSSEQDSYLTGIAVDGSGNIYYSGYTFDGEMNDGYFGKLSAGGSAIFAKSFGGYAAPEDIAVDSQGNIAIVGTFQFWIDFDPSDALAISEGSFYSDLFVARLDSNGNYQQGTVIDGGESWMGAANIAFAPGGGVIVTGTFSGTVDFDPSTGKYDLIADPSGERSAAFALKLDAAGSFSWASVLGQYGEAGPTGLRIDSSGNVYVAGDFRPKRSDQGGDVGPFDNGYGSQSSLFQLDASGALVQTYRLGGYLDGDAQSLAVDSTGSIFIAGRLWGTADYDPGPDQYSLTAADFGSFSLTKLAAPRTYTPPPTSTPPTTGIPTAIIPTSTPPTTTTAVPDPVPAPAPAATPTLTLTKSDGFSDDRRYFTGLARLLREKTGVESSWKFVSNDSPGFDLDELAPAVSTKQRNGDRNTLPANMLWLLELEDENLLLNPAMGEGDQSVAIIERLLRDHARRKHHRDAETADSTPINASSQRPSTLSSAGYEEIVDEVMSRPAEPAGAAP